jgi:hypothetical protein
LNPRSKASISSAPTTAADPDDGAGSLDVGAGAAECWVLGGNVQVAPVALVQPAVMVAIATITIDITVFLRIARVLVVVTEFRTSKVGKYWSTGTANGRAKRP